MPPDASTNSGPPRLVVYRNDNVTNALRFSFLSVETNEFSFRLAGDTNNNPYFTNHFDVFAATNISGTFTSRIPIWAGDPPQVVGTNVTNVIHPPQWWWVCRAPTGELVSCAWLVPSNYPQLFLVAAGPRDLDHGGLSDAFENLVTLTLTNDATDDKWAGLSVPDNWAVEGSTNTARFLISRLCTNANFPLNVGFTLAGTANFGTDYTLSNVSTNGTNLVATIPAGANEVNLILTALADTMAEGTETATLTLCTNWPNFPVEVAQQSATALILEKYSRLYTSNADFSAGVMCGLEAVSNQIQFKPDLPPQFPYINVACSGRGTVARINTTNGQIIGEYWTAPPVFV